MSLITFGGSKPLAHQISHHKVIDAMKVTSLKYCIDIIISQPPHKKEVIKVLSF